jgi:glycosyltransferase involved in cell wall biosynthesis
VRTLFVSNLLPPEPGKNVFGYAQRSSMLLEAAASLGSLDLLYFVWNPDDAGPLEEKKWEAFFSEKFSVLITVTLCPIGNIPSVFSIKGAWWYLKCLSAGAYSLKSNRISFHTSGPLQVESVQQRNAERPDLVIAQNISALAPLLLSGNHLPPIMFDMDGIEHQKLLQYGEGQSGFWSRIRAHLSAYCLSLGERKAIRRSTCTLICTSFDKDFLEAKWGVDGIAIVPNAVSPKPSFAVPREPVVMFIGTYEYYPNQDAANYLISEVWPHVLRARPDARLWIAGPGSEEIDCYETTKDKVEYLGYIDDVDALYEASRIVVCPLRQGAGMRFKILEAAAYGKPIVSTSFGAFGIELEEGREIKLRDDTESFAAACVDLLNNDDECERLGAAARVRVRQHYKRAEIVSQLGRLMRTTSEI